MGMQARVKTRLSSPLLENASQAVGRHRVSARGDEERVATRIAQKRRTPLSHVTVHGFERDGIQRDDAFLGALAKETDARIREIDISELEPCKFGDTGTTRIEQFEKGLVAQTNGIVFAYGKQSPDVGVARLAPEGRAPTWATKSLPRD